MIVIVPLLGFFASILGLLISFLLRKYKSSDFIDWLGFFYLGIHYHLGMVLFYLRVFPDHMDLWGRFVISGTLFIPSAYLNVGLKEMNLKSRFERPVMVINIVFLILMWTSDLIINGIYEYDFGPYPQAGSLYFIQVITAITLIADGTRLVITKYLRENDVLMKEHLRLSAAAFIIFGLCALDYIPKFSNFANFIHYPFGAMSGIFYSISSFIVIYSILVFLLKNLVLKNKQIELLNKGELEKANIQKEAALTNMKLLQSQLNPHFIFNSLNSIKSAVLTDSQQARTIITKMSSILRWILSKKEQDLMDLKEEVEAVKSYLDIEQIRMGDYLKLNYLIDASLMDKKVPNFIIQPLVENAVKYGQRTSKDNLNIDVQISQKLNFLNISVSNSGKWVDPKSNPHQYSTGVGLTNLKERMTAIFSSNFTLKTNSQNGIVNVRLSIPLT